jgi:cytochrome c oxidase cbb3-type subunit 1
MRHEATPSQWVCLHSLAWLAVGNAVGVLLAVLLLFPALGNVFAPLTYGRWIPVHLNAQLYGWSSIPLIGLLFRLYGPKDGFSPWPRWAIGVWSGALVFASVCWLAGQTSGKLFMEWTGPSLAVMTANMVFLSVVLFLGFLRQRSEPTARWIQGAKLVLLALLACIPFVMYWAASPALFPPINPDSGGATGGSLLGSTLMVIAMMWVFPLVVALPVERNRTVIVQTLVVLIAHFAWFGMLDHGHRSHHEMGQIIGLSSLLIWFPLLVRYFRIFQWPDGSRRWLLAFCGWGAFLLVTATFTFMPGVLERWKFTNALVGHVHAAMGGMVTSFCMLILLTINPTENCRKILCARAPFVFWNVGCLVLILALTWLGTIEASNQGLLYRSAWSADLLYAVRLLAGLMMFHASAWWLVKTIRTLEATDQ